MRSLVQIIVFTRLFFLKDNLNSVFYFQSCSSACSMTNPSKSWPNDGRTDRWTDRIGILWAFLVIWTMFEMKCRWFRKILCATNFIITIYIFFRHVWRNIIYPGQLPSSFFYDSYTEKRFFCFSIFKSKAISKLRSEYETICMDFSPHPHRATHYFNDSKRVWIYPEFIRSDFTSLSDGYLDSSTIAIQVQYVQQDIIQYRYNMYSKT